MFDFPHTRVDTRALTGAQRKPPEFRSDEQRLSEETLSDKPSLIITTESAPASVPKRCKVSEALIAASAAYRSLYNKEPPYFDTTYWLMVFERFYGSRPTDNDDPRWDELLFHKGGHAALSIADELRERGIL